MQPCTVRTTLPAPEFWYLLQSSVLSSPPSRLHGVQRRRGFSWNKGTSKTRLRPLVQMRCATTQLHIDRHRQLYSPLHHPVYNLDDSHSLRSARSATVSSAGATTAPAPSPHHQPIRRCPTSPLPLQANSIATSIAISITTTPQPTPVPTP